MFQVHLNDHDDKSCGWMPWAAHVADFVEKLPELFNPQQKESLDLWMGMGIP